jgi:hypothetical protein
VAHCFIDFAFPVSRLLALVGAVGGVGLLLSNRRDWTTTAANPLFVGALVLLAALFKPSQAVWLGGGTDPE